MKNKDEKWCSWLFNLEPPALEKKTTRTTDVEFWAYAYDPKYMYCVVLVYMYICVYMYI